jgi:hypothetical protein
MIRRYTRFGWGGIACALALAGCAAPAPVGRYQMAGGDNRLLDTSTGAVFEGYWSDDGKSAQWQPRIAAVSPATPATQLQTSPPSNAAAVTPNQQAEAYPNAWFTKRLGETLRSLKASKDEGFLTDTEYARARAAALSDPGGWSTYSRPPNNLDKAPWLHDEIGYLSQLHKDGLLSDDEFEKVRSLFAKEIAPSEQ